MAAEASLSRATVAAIEGVLGLYDPPLWLVTACADQRCGGLIATSVTRASIVAEAPRMLVAIARQHHTWGLIQASGRFALHLLPADHLDAVWRFGLPSGHLTDKFAGLAPAQTPDGNPLYPDAVSWMDCRVEQEMNTGDRTAYLAEVVGAGLLRAAPVLTLATLLREAPRERKAELDRLYARDQVSDALAIAAWRDARRAP